MIRIVGCNPGIPAGQLAKLLHLHPSTLTGILQRLEQRGLIRRRADPSDARRTLLGLTHKGRAGDVDPAGTVEASVARVLERTPTRKISAARNVWAEVALQLGRSVTELHAPTRTRARGQKRAR